MEPSLVIDVCGRCGPAGAAVEVGGGGWHIRFLSGHLNHLSPTDTIRRITEGSTTEPMLGRQVAPAEYGRLDTFAVDRPVRVEFTTDELQALCPAVDGIQPDIYHAVIRYTAVTEAIESKSLKLMLTTYRDRRIFAEHLVGELADKIAAAGDGIAEVEVTLSQNVRGGIATTVSAKALS